jgi:hypothetical protein
MEGRDMARAIRRREQRERSEAQAYFRRVRAQKEKKAEMLSEARSRELQLRAEEAALVRKEASETRERVFMEYAQSWKSRLGITSKVPQWELAALRDAQSLCPTVPDPPAPQLEAVATAEQDRASAAAASSLAATMTSLLPVSSLGQSPAPVSPAPAGTDASAPSTLARLVMARLKRAPTPSTDSRSALFAVLATRLQQAAVAAGSGGAPVWLTLREVADGLGLGMTDASTLLRDERLQHESGLRVTLVPRDDRGLADVVTRPV